jgi:hypothetical protein
MGQKANCSTGDILEYLSVVNSAPLPPRSEHHINGTQKSNMQKISSNKYLSEKGFWWRKKREEKRVHRQRW